MTRLIPCHTCGDVVRVDENICYSCRATAVLEALTMRQLIVLMVKKSLPHPVKGREGTNNTQGLLYND
jgi:RNA polymerase subunit RPABC4/transcription elongation factor Spt4